VLRLFDIHEQIDASWYENTGIIFKNMKRRKDKIMYIRREFVIAKSQEDALKIHKSKYPNEYTVDESLMEFATPYISRHCKDLKHSTEIKIKEVELDKTTVHELAKIITLEQMHTLWGSLDLMKRSL